MLMQKGTQKVVSGIVTFIDNTNANVTLTINPLNSAIAQIVAVECDDSSVTDRLHKKMLNVQKHIMVIPLPGGHNAAFEESADNRSP